MGRELFIPIKTEVAMAGMALILNF